MNNYLKIRRSLKKILPEYITLIPGRSLSKQEQENFLVLVDFLQSGKSLNKKDIKEFGYTLLFCNNKFLITYNIETITSIKWYLNSKLKTQNYYPELCIMTMLTLEDSTLCLLNVSNPCVIIRQSTRNKKNVFVLDSNISKNIYNDVLIEIDDIGFNVINGVTYRCFNRDV